MTSIYKWLKEDKISSDDIIVDKIRAFKSVEGNDQRARSLALRLLMHYVGDVHQPLHCLSRYLATDKNGDAGGNGFQLKYKYRVK